MGKIVVQLNGRINKCGVISPRYDISHNEIEDWVGRLLPSRQFGKIVLTTNSGIIDHEESRRRKVGGKVLGFFYRSGSARNPGWERGTGGFRAGARETRPRTDIDGGRTPELLIKNREPEGKLRSGAR